MVLHSFCYNIFCCECVRKKEKPVISKPFGLTKSVVPQTNLFENGDKYNDSVCNDSLNYKTPITRQPTSEAVTTRVFMPETIENESRNSEKSNLQDTVDDATVNDGISAVPTDELEQDNIAQTSVAANKDLKEISNVTSETLSYTIIENDDTRISASRNESEHIKKPIPLPRFNKVGKEENLNNTIVINNECMNREIENETNKQSIVFDTENLEELENNNTHTETIAMPFPSSESKQLEEECYDTIIDDFEYRNAKIENDDQNVDLNADNQEELINNNNNLEKRAVPFPSSKLADSSVSTYVPVYGKPTFIVADEEVEIKFHLVDNTTTVNKNMLNIKSDFTGYTHKAEGNCEEIRPS